jgi:hypothetical protein
MQFDAEGHVVVTPREWQERLQDAGTLTRDVWLVGTPWAFSTYAKFREFVVFLADRLGVHPNNIAVRGSTKVGFSISPPRKTSGSVHVPGGPGTYAASGRFGTPAASLQDTSNVAKSMQDRSRSGPSRKNQHHRGEVREGFFCCWH